jgi:hypothetical protein
LEGLSFKFIPGKTFILDTDASQTAIGAVLSQEFDGKEQVIAYMSKALNKAKQSYCVTRKELLAVVSSLKHLKQTKTITRQTFFGNEKQQTVKY